MQERQREWQLRGPKVGMAKGLGAMDQEGAEGAKAEERA